LIPRAKRKEIRKKENVAKFAHEKHAGDQSRDRVLTDKK